LKVPKRLQAVAQKIREALEIAANDARSERAVPGGLSGIAFQLWLSACPNLEDQVSCLNYSIPPHRVDTRNFSSIRSSRLLLLSSIIRKPDIFPLNDDLNKPARFGLTSAA
jgi:hypothetical protein